MEKLDDLRSFPSPVFVVPGICRGESLHSTEQVSWMINGCYQTCQSESARSTQLTQQHLGLDCQDHTRLLTREKSSASTGKPPDYAKARTTGDSEFTTATLVSFHLDWSSVQAQTQETVVTRQGIYTSHRESMMLTCFQTNSSSSSLSLRPRKKTNSQANSPS